MVRYKHMHFTVFCVLLSTDRLGCHFLSIFRSMYWIVWCSARSVTAFPTCCCTCCCLCCFLCCLVLGDPANQYINGERMVFGNGLRGRGALLCAIKRLRTKQSCDRLLPSSSRPLPRATPEDKQCMSTKTVLKYIYKCDVHCCCIYLTLTSVLFISVANSTGAAPSTRIAVAFSILRVSRVCRDSSISTCFNPEKLT